MTFNGSINQKQTYDANTELVILSCFFRFTFNYFLLFWASCFVGENIPLAQNRYDSPTCPNPRYTLDWGREKKLDEKFSLKKMLRKNPKGGNDARPVVRNLFLARGTLMSKKHLAAHLHQKNLYYTSERAFYS
jgi:hypothetical protein